MSDINFKFRADQLGKDIEAATPKVIEEINQAVADLAHASYAAILAKAQEQLSGTRQDYVSGLQFDKLGDDSYLISLSGDLANRIEEGFGPYDMKPGMLGSKKIVGVGSRSGQPWVRQGKDGQKYAAVPFEHSPSKPKQTGNLENDIKKLLAFNRQGSLQKITKTFTDDLGKPLAGKVATAHNAEGNLEGLVKFQHVAESGRVSSMYMTWRIVSEKSTGWKHPGYAGLKAFAEAEDYITKELDNIIKTLL